MSRLRRRFRYALDSLMSRGAGALLIPLCLIVGVVLGIVTTAVVLADSMPDRTMSLPDILWTVFGYMYDPVPMPYNAGGWVLRFLLLIASLVGIVVLSTLIGIITTAFSTMLERLRKGKSVVEEDGHTLIVGWSEQVYGVVQELVIANENVKKACIVILADEDKVEMEDRLRARIRTTGNTRIVCRSGSPIDMTDLAIVRPERARSIILLAPEDHPNPDNVVVKTMLAIVHSGGEVSTATIVATMKDPSNIDVASIIGGDRVRIIPNELVISQIITQTCRQPGLSMVYTELLDFGGDELYVKEEPGLVGETFGAALHAYEDSALIGIRYADGNVVVNPEKDALIGAGDKVIVLSSDDDTIRLRQGAGALIDEQHIATSPRPERLAERILILGWSERGAIIVQELDQYVAAGSTLHVVHHMDHRDAVSRFNDKAQSITLSFTQGETTSRSVLNMLPISEFDSIVVLADREAGGVQESDARTLMTVIHLRDIIKRSGCQVNIVTEMLDDRNRELAAVASDHDFIVSNKITSLLLTQIAESPDLALVFAELFNADGSELYLRSASQYVDVNHPVNFATVVEAAARRNEVALGHRLVENGVARVQMNVRKSEIRKYTSEDSIVVIAHD